MKTFSQIARESFIISSGETKTVGSIVTLPAGGPWFIHGIWCNAITSVEAAGKVYSGYFNINSIKGDIFPDPAPGNYPFFTPGLFTTEGQGSWSVPTIIHPTLWEAAGKAQIQFSITSTGNTQWQVFAHCGIIFGDVVPQRRPRIFCDTISGLVIDTEETLIGTFELSERASRITAILGDIMPTAPRFTGRPIDGFYRLDSDDVDLNPAQFPYTRFWPPGSQNGYGSSSVPKLDFIDLDIKVAGGARINVFSKSLGNPSTANNVQIFLAYE